MKGRAVSGSVILTDSAEIVGRCSSPRKTRSSSAIAWRGHRTVCGAMNYQIPSLAKLELPSESFVAFLRAAPNDMPTFSADVCPTRTPPISTHSFNRFRGADR
jgi:hypothetical protein